MCLKLYLGEGDCLNNRFSCISIFQAAARGQAEQEELAKKMEVCETCGSLLVANDTQQRVDEHLMGKQHMGYARIRAFIEERKVVPFTASTGFPLDLENLEK